MLPVYERVRQLMILFHGVSALRDSGFQINDILRNDLIEFRDSYIADQTPSIASQYCFRGYT